MSNETDEMMDATHPEDEQIQAYVQAPELADFRQLRLHIAGCRFCRRRAELTALVREQGHVLETEPVELNSDAIAMIDGKIEESKAEKIRDQLKQNPAELRAALHYASHTRAMAAEHVEEKPQSMFSLMIEWLNDFMNFHAPVWKTAPVAAVLVILVMTSVNQFDNENESGENRIIAFNDNPVIQILGQETQPGIGFFNQGVSSEPFSGIQVRLLGGDELHLSWPEVANSLSYNLKLQVFKNGETKLLSRQTLDTTSAIVALTEILPGHRYEWTLSGDIDDSKSFQTSGGFVITSTQVSR